MNCFGRFCDSDPALSIFFLILFPIIFIGLGIAALVFWICMLIDAIKHAPEKTKTVWVIVIIFTHIVGAFIYYFVEKRERKISKKEERQKEEK